MLQIGDLELVERNKRKQNMIFVSWKGTPRECHQVADGGGNEKLM